MSIPTPTHTVRTNLGFTWTRTTWNHGPFALILEKIEGKDGHDENLDWGTSIADHKLPEIEANKYDWEKGESSYGVKWRSHFARTTDEARDYAQAIIMASEAAEIFTTIRNNHQ